MTLQNFSPIRGAIFQHVKIDITDKSEQTIALAKDHYRVKVFRLVVTGRQHCKFKIRSGSEEVRDIFIGSDCVPHIESSGGAVSPILIGETGSDLTVYQSDLASVDASVYVQYRYDSGKF